MFVLSFACDFKDNGLAEVHVHTLYDYNGNPSTNDNNASDK